MSDRLTRQGVRDLSTMGPRHPERNKKASDYARGPNEWQADPFAFPLPRGVRLLKGRAIFGDPDLGEE